MSNGIDFSSIEQYKKKLEEMGRKGVRLEDEALTAGAEIILEEMKKTASFKDRTENLRKGLKINKPQKIKGIRTVKIGIQKDDNSEIFYGKFIEYGTSRGKASITAKPFMRPAFENKRGEALKKTREIIRKGLGL
jgi:HK97 gp10 family phage protein